MNSVINVSYYLIVLISQSHEVRDGPDTMLAAPSPGQALSCSQLGNSFDDDGSIVTVLFSETDWQAPSLRPSSPGLGHTIQVANQNRNVMARRHSL